MKMRWKVYIRTGKHETKDNRIWTLNETWFYAKRDVDLRRDVLKEIISEKRRRNA